MPKRGPKPRKPLTAPAPDGWEPPAHLSAGAAAAWTHLVGQLAAAGNLARTDPTLVEAYACCVDMLRQSHAAIKADGPYIKNGMGATAAHPAFAVVNSATMRVKAIIDSLGLCPSASKHAAGTHEPKAASKWGSIFAG